MTWVPSCSTFMRISATACAFRPLTKLTDEQAEYLGIAPGGP